MPLSIDGQLISEDEKAYLIADIGHNHSGSMDRLEEMVLAARDSGVNAVKFQTRNPKEVYSPSEYYRKSDNPQWMDETYGIHREKLEWSPEEWKHVFDFCKTVGVTAFSTPFDFRSLDLLLSLDVPAIKIASGDATNLPLIGAAASHNIPMIISTGGCNIEEVDAIVQVMTLKKTPFAILQCSCIYPAPHDVLNIKVIQGYKDRYPDIETGLSTHDPDIHPTLAAFALGGRIFEHHFTVNRRWKGTDNAFSLTPAMMKELRKNIDDVFLSLGSLVKTQDPREKVYTDERRKSLYWAATKNQGETVSDNDIKIQCPANIMHPADMYTLIGKKIHSLKVTEGNPVTEVDVI